MSEKEIATLLREKNGEMISNLIENNVILEMRVPVDVSQFTDKQIELEAAGYFEKGAVATYQVSENASGKVQAGGNS